MNYVIHTYRWPYSWKGMGGQPRVTPLLSAMIEGNLERIQKILSAGGSFDKADEATVKRVLYEKMSDESLICFLVEQGLITSNRNPAGSGMRFFECIDPEGYSWGLLARAWYVKSYRAMDVLARYRFDDTLFCIKGEEYVLEKLIFQLDDVRAFKILQENGMEHAQYNAHKEFLPWLKWRKQFPNSKVTEYLEHNPVPARRSLGLDVDAFVEIPKPYLETAGVFKRRAAVQRNEIRMRDYEDRVRAQKEYLAWIYNK